MNEKVEACATCGIRKGFNLYPDCKREADKWGVDLEKAHGVEEPLAGFTGLHLWGSFTKTTEGFSVLEDIEALRQQLFDQYEEFRRKIHE